MLRSDGLYLWRSTLSSTGSRCYSYVYSVQELELGDNKLEDVPVGLFTGLHGLQRLSLNGNNLTELSKALFADLYDLKVLTPFNGKGALARGTGIRYKCWVGSWILAK